MPRRPDYEDPWGQDRYVSPEEERFAAEMGQPSDWPMDRHETYRRNRASGLDHEQAIAATGRSLAAVLCQEPVRCNRCDRMTVPQEDVLSLDAEGNLVHAECL